MAYAFLAHLYGSDDQGLFNTMNGIEYAPHTDPHWDPFSVVYKVSLRYRFGIDLLSEKAWC